MAAKCNIAGLVLEKINNAKWGLDCESSSLSIMETYIQFLGCEDVPVSTCAPKDCIVEATIFNCNFNILTTSLDVVEDNLTFSFKLGDIIGGKQPFTYNWTFDTEDFTAQGPTNQATLLLKLNPGKDLSILVSKLTMQITDADECFDQKVVWLVNGEIINWNYVGCPNPNDLIVVNKFKLCPPPSGLLVIRK